jgi:hypothetical protein
MLHNFYARFLIMHALTMFRDGVEEKSGEIDCGTKEEKWSAINNGYTCIISRS